MKNKILLIFIITGLFACKNEIVNKHPKLKINNLYKVEFIKIDAKGKTLNISLNDDSFIYFDDYITLKSDIFLYQNYKMIDKYEIVNMSFTQSGRDNTFRRRYTRKQIDSLYSELNNNKYLVRNYSYLVNDFNISEIWNLKSEALNVSKKIKDTSTLDYLELIKFYSKHQKEKKNLQESPVYQRMILIRNMFAEIGIEDVWTQKRKKAPDFIKKLDNIIEK
jgi:hypothetical protein